MLAIVLAAIVMSGHEHWIAGTGVMKGNQIAVLAGNPAKPGLFIVRVKLPAGTVFRPHYHVQTEDLTVVSGTLWSGLGDKVDAAKMTALPAGSFVSIPATLHHYVMAKVPTVIELTAMGPLSVIEVKP